MTTVGKAARLRNKSRPKAPKKPKPPKFTIGVRSADGAYMTASAECEESLSFALWQLADWGMDAESDAADPVPEREEFRLAVIAYTRSAAEYMLWCKQMNDGDDR